MEKILRLLCVICVIITSILLFDSHSINVEGRHHISKKTNSKIVSYAPITIKGCVNESLPSPSLSPAASPSNVAPSESPDFSPDYIFDVMEYGAVGDGSTGDTEAFIETCKDACQVESVVLLAPIDRTFMITTSIFSDPCKPGLEFQVDGALMPPKGPKSWPREDDKKQWIYFYRLDNMTFTGTGTIEGWELPCKPHSGPNGFTLSGPCDSPTVSQLHFLSSQKYFLV
ncbi:hypothetical protein P3L10_015406 [Capsicum annuum]